MGRSRFFAVVYTIQHAGFTDKRTLGPEKFSNRFRVNSFSGGRTCTATSFRVSCFKPNRNFSPKNGRDRHDGSNFRPRDVQKRGGARVTHVDIVNSQERPTSSTKHSSSWRAPFLEQSTAPPAASGPGNGWRVRSVVPARVSTAGYGRCTAQQRAQSGALRAGWIRRRALPDGQTAVLFFKGRPYL